MRRKGISPLIAAVLLIAFTVSISAMTGPFFTQLIEDIQTGTEDSADTITSAANADLEIRGVNYEQSSGNYKVTFQNTGSTDIENFTATALGEKPYQKNIATKLGANEIHTFTLETSSSTDEDKLQVEAENMPVKDEEDLENTITGAAPASPTELTLSTQN